MFSQIRPLFCLFIGVIIPCSGTKQDTTFTHLGTRHVFDQRSTFPRAGHQAVSHPGTAHCTQTQSWTVRHRSLNKAFGADRCPCLNHLLKNTPYLAIGPNDDHCSVHGADESVDPKLLSICAKQLKGVIEVMSS